MHANGKLNTNIFYKQIILLMQWYTSKAPGVPRSRHPKDLSTKNIKYCHNNKLCSLNFYLFRNLLVSIAASWILPFLFIYNLAILRACLKRGN